MHITNYFLQPIGKRWCSTMGGFMANKSFLVDKGLLLVRNKEQEINNFINKK